MARNLRPDPGPGLVILSTSPAAPYADGRLGLSRKFLDGVRAYQQHWPGRVTVLLEPAERPTGDLDHVRVWPAELGFTTLVAPFSPGLLHGVLDQQPPEAVVLGMLASRHVELEQRLRSAGVTRTPWVLFAEHNLATRWRIAALSTANPLLRLRRLAGVLRRERRLVQAAGRVAGLQCNGTPAFAQYGPANDNSLLYFDGRLTAGLLPTPAAVQARVERNARAGRLRLVFSGRLATIKGADHLVEAALELRRLGVPFELAICGDGELRPAIEQRLRQHELTACVQVRGTLDFETELVPLVRDWADLFVCPHRQGDPSCTYLETLGCGVPIVGYANEAFVGVVRHSQAGWLVPLDQPRRLGETIAALAADRAALGAASAQALAFGAQHRFERTFEARTRHLLATAGQQVASVRPVHA
jgi:glycosyltransferase involved in cell wall biosynthesis